MTIKIFHSSKPSANARQSGLTLIELMVALLLGAFLTGGLIQIFISSRQSYRLTDNLSRLQENARFALELLSHDIRLAGYIGCSRIAANNPAIIANDPLVAPRIHSGNAGVVAAPPLTAGNDNTGSFISPSPALSSALAANTLTNVIRGTDAITVQFGESCDGYTSSAINTANITAANLAANSCGANNPGTPLIISDCDTSHIYRESADSSRNKDETGTAALFLGKSYGIGSEVLLFRSYTYFIRTGPGGQPSLYRFDNNRVTSSSNPAELVEGVENMQITYGIDTDADGSANQYVNAPGTAQIADAVSVRVALTLRSLDDNVMSVNNQQRVFNGANLTDRRLLKTFTSTINLRNE